MWEKYGSINLLDAQVRLFECCFEAHGHWNDCGYIRNLFMWAVRGAAMRHVSDIVCKRLLGKAFTTAHLIFTTARKLYNRLQTPRTVCRLCCYDAYAASVHFSIYYFLFFWVISFLFYKFRILYSLGLLDRWIAFERPSVWVVSPLRFMLWACFEILLWLHSVHLRRTFPSDLQKMQFRAFCDEEADFGKSAKSLVKHLRADFFSGGGWVLDVCRKNQIFQTWKSGGGGSRGQRASAASDLQVTCRC